MRLDTAVAPPEKMRSNLRATTQNYKSIPRIMEPGDHRVAVGTESETPLTFAIEL